MSSGNERLCMKAGLLQMDLCDLQPRTNDHWQLLHFMSEVNIICVIHTYTVHTMYYTEVDNTAIASENFHSEMAKLLQIITKETLCNIELNVKF